MIHWLLQYPMCLRYKFLCTFTVHKVTLLHLLSLSNHVCILSLFSRNSDRIRRIQVRNALELITHKACHLSPCEETRLD